MWWGTLHTSIPVARPEFAKVILFLHNATSMHWLPPWGLPCIWADFAHSHFTVPSLSSHYRIHVLMPAQSCSTQRVLLDLDGVPQMSFLCLIIWVTDNQIGSAQIQLESAWICSLGRPPGRWRVSLPRPQLALESTFTCAPAEPASLCDSRCTHTAIENRKKKSQHDLSGIFWNQYMSPVDFSTWFFLPFPSLLLYLFSPLL